jgi:cell division protein FtsI (penicillin-binding protein 3)
MRMMKSNEALNGCAIVMEVATGKIKAIANLGRTQNGNYWENLNYAITSTEPGSTFKLVTLIAALEDKKANINSPVDLNGGTWQINGQTVYDSEQHGLHTTDIRHAFEQSSNVGMAKLAYYNYGSNPSQFINHIHQLKLDSLTGIDLNGEGKSRIYKPGTASWSNTTLPWMAFGYNLTVTPLHTAMLYNAVANNGKMMKPYLVCATRQDGKKLDDFFPVVTNEKICSDETMQQIKSCLEGVCTNGTAKTLFKNNAYKVAGKTGTALVADGKYKYADKVYQTSFAGYFPADNPQYTIVVVIKNKPGATLHYGATVAGPVFKEIADRLYTLYVKQNEQQNIANNKKDSGAYNYAGYTTDLQSILAKLQMNFTKTDATENGWSKIAKTTNNTAITSMQVSDNQMPFLKGMGLKDAVTVCENMGLKVTIKGRGKVANQSIGAGQMIAKGQVIHIELN